MTRKSPPAGDSKSGLTVAAARGPASGATDRDRPRSPKIVRSFANFRDMTSVPADFLDAMEPLRPASQPSQTGAGPVRPRDKSEEPGVPIDLADSGDYGMKVPDGSDRKLVVEYFDQDLSLIDSEIAFVGHYLGVSQIGPAAEFNKKLIMFSQSVLASDDRKSYRRRFRTSCEEEGRKSDLVSLEKFIELGIVVSNLGALNLFPLPEGLSRLEDPARKIVPRHVLLGGFGEPGHMNRENVRFVFTNVVYAMKCMGLTVMSTSLVGTLRRVLNTQQSLRAILEGVEEGMRRFDVDTIDLRIAYVGEAQGRIVKRTLDSLRDTRAFNGRLLFEPAEKPGPGRPTGFDQPSRDESEAYGESAAAQITVTSANVDEFLLTSTDSDKSKEPEQADHSMKKRVLKYSALSSSSIIPVRRVAVQDYFADMLPKRVLSQARPREQWQYGYLMMRCFFPEDFQRIVEDGTRLTLVLDRETAQIPWEMAGFKLRSDERFFGTDIELSRQFRSVLGETNGHAPELNHMLRVLIIADPATDQRDALEFAKAEGIDVAGVIADARAAYGDYDENDHDSPGRMDIRIYLRIGNRERDGRIEQDERLTALKAACGDDIDIDRCDPVEILKLLMTEDFDIVHYAGHGMFDPETGAMGWLIDSNCFLTAEEIFRVRRVPRLVFANSCHSGRLQAQLSIEDAVARQVGMAEAFFSRGIENYVGTAWEVEDMAAREMAATFYRNALGVMRAPDSGAVSTIDPQTIGASLKLARKQAIDRLVNVPASDATMTFEQARQDVDVIRGTSWGAYQHYGLPEALLVIPLNKKGHE